MSNSAISGYRILKPIGTGGTSKIFLAIQKSVGRTVAIKVLSKQFSDDKSFSERFLKEANCGVLNHPNIITIYDAGKSNGRLYIAMEYLLGGDLKSKMLSKISEAEAIKIITQITQALSHAHNNNFTHRDIKPGNILFDENDNAILADFGIAKTIHFSETSVSANGFIGTPNYISPEQIENAKVDYRADLYCLGIVYYEMLTGEKPFIADSPYSLLFKHLKEPAPSLPKKFKHHQNIIHKLLEKKPEKRYQSADLLLKDLQTFKAPAKKQHSMVGILKTTAVLVSLLISLLAILYFQFIDKQIKKVEPVKTVYKAPQIDSKTIDKLKKDIEASSAKTAESEKKRIELEKTLQHLTEAARYLSTNQYISPEKNNALYEFNQALAIQPDNTQARYGIQTIINHYKLLANNEKTKENYKQSLTYIESALVADKNNIEILKLNEEVKRLYEQQIIKRKTSKALNKANKLISKKHYKKARRVLTDISNLNKNNKRIRNLLKHVNKEIKKQNHINSLISKSTRLLNETPISEININMACESIYSLLHLEPDNQSIIKIKNSCAKQYLSLAKKTHSNEDALEYVETGLNYKPDDAELIEYKIKLNL